MKTSLLMMTVAAGVLGLSGAASAEIVTVAYTGTVELITDNGGLPPVSDGDMLVATYVFNLPNATDTDIGPTGGFSSGPYGSFVTASLASMETRLRCQPFRRARSTERPKLRGPEAF